MSRSVIMDRRRVAAGEDIGISVLEVVEEMRRLVGIDEARFSKRPRGVRSGRKRRASRRRWKDRKKAQSFLHFYAHVMGRSHDPRDRITGCYG